MCGDNNGIEKVESRRGLMGHVIGRDGVSLVTGFSAPNLVSMEALNPSLCFTGYE